MTMVTSRVEPDSARARRLRFRLPSAFTSSGLVLALGSIALVIYPMYRIFAALFYHHGHIDFSAFRDFANAPGMGTAIANTSLIVGISSPLAVLLGGAMAWVNERTDGRLAGVTDILPYMSFFVPQIALAIGSVFLFSPTGGLGNVVIRDGLSKVGIHMDRGPINIYSIYGLAFLYMLYAIPYAFLIISAGIRSIDSQLEEQARMCGSGRLQALRKVVFPALAPSLASALLLAVWTGYGHFSVPRIVAEPAGLQIMSVSIVRFLTFNETPQYGPAVVMSLIMIFLVGMAWYLQTTITRRARHSLVGSRGHRAPRMRLGGWKWPIRAVFLLYIIVSSVLPILALCLVALNGFWTPHLRWSKFNLDAVHAVFNDNQTYEALKDSLYLAIVVATLGALVAAVVSVLTRSKLRGMRTLDASIKLPVIVSHVVLALGFILAFGGPPFNLGATRLILILAFFALYMPQATVVTDGVASLVGTDLAEASRIFGASSIRTFHKVFLPLMVSGIAMAWVLLFTRILGDLEVSSLLASANNPTIGSQVLNLYANGKFGDIAALTVLLMAVTVTVVGVVLALGRRQARWAVAETIAAPIAR